MTLEHDLRHTVTSEAVCRAIRRHRARRREPHPPFNPAAWLAEFWEFLCGR